jgi:ketosteroid isomerase-like protein
VQPEVATGYSWPRRDNSLVASANLNLVRSIFAAWERGDYSSVEWAHPEIEYVIADGPAPGTWRGLAGMAAGFRDVLGAAKELRVVAEEYRELDRERVLVLIRYGGRGRTSGLEFGELRSTGAHVFHLRDGKVTRFVAYWDRERALADLGLTVESRPRHS